MDFPFADDCALVSHNQPDMQTILNPFSDACEDFGLAINITKTEQFYQLVLCFPVHLLMPNN